MSVMDTLTRIEIYHTYDLYAYRDSVQKDGERERLFHVSYLLVLVNITG
jgi:hypothetical protein